jgi:hypothetical protein
MAFNSTETMNSQQLWRCPMCQKPNFTLAGLKRHWCESADAKGRVSWFYPTKRRLSAEQLALATRCEVQTQLPMEGERV